MSNLLKTFEASRPFSDSEAWLLFRLAAFSEAIGWTLLIAGLLSKRYLFGGHNWPVLIAGQFHGTIFLAYMVAALGLYPSLGWSRRKGIVALIASVPPYGSLIFEQYAAHKRHRYEARAAVSWQLYQKLLTVVQ